MSYLLRIGGNIANPEDFAPFTTGKGVEKIQTEITGNHLTVEITTAESPEVDKIINRLRSKGMEVISHVLNPTNGSVIEKSSTKD